MGKKILILGLGLLCLPCFAGCTLFGASCREGCAPSSNPQENGRRKKLESLDAPPRFLPGTKQTGARRPMETIVVAGERSRTPDLLNASSTPIAPLDTPPPPLSRSEQGAKPSDHATATDPKRLGVPGQIEILPREASPPTSVSQRPFAKHEVHPGDDRPSAVRDLEVVSPKAPTKMALIKTVPIEIANGRQTDGQGLTGQVHRYRKSWRLRYADAGKEDRHGGVVVLEGGAELSNLREGQRVLVTGTMMPPPDRTGQARYRVQSLQILD
jgi:hypothetical protein